MLAKILRSLSPLALAAALLTLIAPAPLVAQAPSSVVANRLTQPIDDSARITLKGTVHPLASAANDRGAASASMPLDRLTLVLKRSDAQETALKQFISDAHTPGSASYHKWLTPDQFGKQFGPSDSDLATIQAWLQSHGFAVTKVNAGRQSLEISGNAGQFRDTFHSQIHKYVVNDETHYANSTDPQIPAALAPVVSGFASLNNFRLKSHARVLGQATYNTQTHTAKPQWTYGNSSGVNFPLAPQDYAVQYDLNPLYTAGTKGTGQTIAIVNDSNINIYLVNQFRSIFNLPANPPQVIIDGNDPGVDGINNPDGANHDSIEAYLDVEWSGAVAPNATIDLVIGADTAIESGLILALEHAIYGNVAPVVSLSFGTCELSLGSSNLFLSTLYEQAAAQGQTVLVSSGDSGSAACDGSNRQFAVNGQQVSGYASTPYNVAVGGTDFFYSAWNQGTSAIDTQLGTYWNGTPQQSPAQSITKVIPEQPWNDSQYGLNINDIFQQSGQTTIAGGGGGASNCATVNSSGACTGGYPKPAWQKGAGVPSDSVRDIPDVSLFAADGVNLSYYPICYADGDCQPASGSNLIQITGVGGTSASTPAFAGIMALVNQLHGPQGQANFVLYPLKAQFPTAFHDVTNGTNSVPCNINTTSTGIKPFGCIAVANPITNISDSAYGTANEGQIGTGTTPQYNAAAGYNLATGLGTIDANVLVSNWANVQFTSTTTTLTPSPTSFAHGTAVNITGSVTAASGTPTGSVALLTDSTDPVTQAFKPFTLNNTGAFSGSPSDLPGGTYNIWGQYSGDSSNGPSTSQKTSITVTPENSGVYFNIFSPAGTTSSGSIASGASIDYGTQLLLSAQVVPSSELSCFVANSGNCPSFGPATGTVAFADNGSTINTAVVNAESDAGYNAPFAVGSHSVNATYNGDNSYNKSSASAITFKVVQDTPQILFSASNQVSSTQFANGQPTVFNIEVLNGAAFNSATNTSVFPVPISPPTGTVTVSGLPGGTQTITLSPATDPAYLGRAGIATITVASTSNTGSYTAKVSYPGDSNYQAASGSFPVQFGSLGGLSTTTAATMTGSTISPSTSITISGTVTGQSGHGAPTGSVFIFSSGYAFNQQLPLNPGSGDVSTFSATFNSQTLFQGANFITLQYTGDNTYNISATTLNNGLAISNPLSDFSMVPETTIVPVTSGGSKTDTINVSSVNGFAGAVSFTCVGTTVTCTVTSSATLSAGSTAPLTLTVNAGSGVAGGNYNVLVTGTDSTGKYVHTLGIRAAVAGSTTPSFSLSAAPNSLNLTAGATTGNTSVITATPANSFTGTVALACAVTPPSGATSPATCSLSPTSVDITSGAVTSTLTVDTTATTTAGTYTVTVTGTSGSLAPTTIVTVAVAAPATPNFALSASPTTLSLTGGATTGNTSTISVTPSGGFTGNVALACVVTGPSGATSPATCSVSPATAMVSGTGAVASTLTVATTSTTTGGTYTVTTTGTSGTLTSNAAVTVTVTAPPTLSYALSNSGGITVTQGNSGTSTISVTPSGGFTGNVALSCTSSNSSAVSCSLNPATADVTGTSAVTSTLTINASSNSGALERPLDKLFTIGGGAALALLVFFGIPARRRSWRAILGVVLFGAIVSIGIGCGSSSGSGGSASYTITVTGTNGSASQTTTVSVTVNK